VQFGPGFSGQWTLSPAVGPREQIPLWRPAHRFFFHKEMLLLFFPPFAAFIPPTSSPPPPNEPGSPLSDEEGAFLRIPFFHEDLAPPRSQFLFSPKRYIFNTTGNKKLSSSVLFLSLAPFFRKNFYAFLADLYLGIRFFPPTMPFLKHHAFFSPSRLISSPLFRGSCEIVFFRIVCKFFLKDRPFPWQTSATPFLQSVIVLLVHFPPPRPHPQFFFFEDKHPLFPPPNNKRDFPLSTHGPCASPPATLFLFASPDSRR